MEKGVEHCGVGEGGGRGDNGGGGDGDEGWVKGAVGEDGARDARRETELNTDGLQAGVELGSGG